jgi:hypothetical protein
MTIPINNQLLQFFKDIENDKNGVITQNYTEYLNSLNYILELKDENVQNFHNKYKINTTLSSAHFKQIIKYAVKSTDERPVLFKLVYGIWLYTHTPNLI